MRYDYSIQRGMLNAGAARSESVGHIQVRIIVDDPIARTQQMSLRIDVALWSLAASIGQYNTALRVSLLQLPQDDWQSGAGVNGIAEHGLHSTIGAG